MSRDDPFETIRDLLIDCPKSHSWRPDETWAAEARGEVSRLIGVVDEPWPEIAVTFSDAVEEEDYFRRRVEFSSHRGWRGRGWLLSPRGLDQPRPGVVCLPGHGVGVDGIVGLIDEPYQANFALQCVRRGWETLAVEQVSFGANRSERAKENQSSCVVDSLAALLLGETVTGWRVRDAMAARRTLVSLGTVDPERIGIVGISGGGLTSLWAGALDRGFCAVGVSGYFTPMLHSILRFDHCPDNYVPGFGRLMDVPDLAGLVAPRFLAVENGTEDPIFAEEGFLEACRLAERIFQVHGNQDRFLYELFPGGHEFRGRGIFEHFERALGPRKEGWFRRSSGTT